MQARARNDLARLFAEELAEAGLDDGAIDDSFDAAAAGADRARARRANRSQPRGDQGPAQRSRRRRRWKDSCARPGFRGQLEERDGVLFAVIDSAGRGAPREVLGEAIAAHRRATFRGPSRCAGASSASKRAALGAAAARHRRAARRGDRAGRHRRHRERRDDRRPPLPPSRARSPSAARAIMSRNCAPAMSSSTRTSARRSIRDGAAKAAAKARA